MQPTVTSPLSARPDSSWKRLFCSLLRSRLERFSTCVLLSAFLMAMAEGTDLNAQGSDGSSSDKKLAILPASIELSHKDSTQNVQAHYVDRAGVYDAPLREGLRWKSSDESVFRVQDNQVIAVSDGQAQLLLEWEKNRESASVPVMVRSTSEPKSIEFRNHIQAVFAKAGCNMGACHGALAGKGGFRLSLRGYDATTDHFNITRQDRGRRIELSDPGLSLLLTKPSGAVSHKGGLRLAEGSEDYQLIASWIAEGAKPPSEADPKLVRVEVVPELSQLQIGQEQSLIVRAHYSQGRVEDVTKWAKFSSTDDAVLNVDDRGTIKVVGAGEGSIVVWFASRIVTARTKVPFPNRVSPELYERAPIANKIDHLVLNQLQQLRLVPSPRCEDHEFIRRSYLDTIGRLPTEEEVLDFMGDPASDKRSRWIDRLLERPEFIDYWTYRWSDVLMLNGNLLRPDAIKAYYQWIRSHVARNTPWDQVVREILTAKGESLENGATNFYALNQDPESMTENACQAFLGLSIGCAKCHNHPLEKWTNDQYYAMANMFARVRAKGWGGDARDGDGKRTLVILDRGDLIQPITGKPQPPAPLDSPPLNPQSPADRREALADWLTSPSNPYFTRSIVNRVWANFFGIGMVNAVDDMRASNPPSNPELMAALEQELIDSRYDLKSLMRLILNSETYQRSSLPVAENRDENKYFARSYPRRLMAEVMHDAICQVTGVPTKFTEIEFLGADKRPTNFYPEGTRAIQLYDTAVRSYFLKTFGRNQRRITCECERSDEPSVVQVLHLNNGDTLNEKLASKNSVVHKLLDAHGGDPKTLVERAFLSCLGRPPTSEESARLTQELTSAEGSEKPIVVEDLFWSLMTSREFLFNH